MTKRLPNAVRDHVFAPRRIWRRAIAVAAAVGCILCSHLALASCVDGKRLVGVNLSGAEFTAQELPGQIFKDYVYPDPADMRHFQAQGMNTFRLPFLWERIQPHLFGALDPAELQRIADTVAAARSLNACVILDVHNYGEYRGQAIGAGVPRAALIDLWLRLSATFKDPANVAFGLMNEPAKLPVAEWAATAQETVTALRKNGALHLILVSGGGWSGAHSWSVKGAGVSNADAFHAFRDPANRYMIEVHQYADADASGTHSSCVDPERMKVVMAGITRWAVSTRQRLFLGEFGVPVNAQCLQALAAIVGGTKGSPVWGGWTYWAAGKWWGTYPFSIQPDGKADKPQMAVLKAGM